MTDTIETPPLRVGLLDDHAVVRGGYRRLIELEDDLVVACEFSDAESAYAALANEDDCALDVLVLDLSLPGQSGLDLLRRLSLRRPALRVLVFTMHDAPATVEHCLRAGAAGFVTKISAPEVLLEALRLVACGELALSSDVARARHAEGQALHAVLSVREFAILEYLVAGQGVEQIARAVHLSVKTVANYQTEIRRKLGVRNAVELLRYVRGHGIADV